MDKKGTILTNDKSSANPLTIRRIEKKTIFFDFFSLDIFKILKRSTKEARFDFNRFRVFIIISILSFSQKIDQKDQFQL